MTVSNVLSLQAELFTSNSQQGVCSKCSSPSCDNLCRNQCFSILPTSTSVMDDHGCATISNSIRVDRNVRSFCATPTPNIVISPTLNNSSNESACRLETIPNLVTKTGSCSEQLEAAPVLEVGAGQRIQSPIKGPTDQVSASLLDVCCADDQNEDLQDIYKCLQLSPSKEPTKATHLYQSSSMKKKRTNCNPF